MKSPYEAFFDHESFAVVGVSSKRPFPVLTFRGLKRHQKRVYAVDPSVNSVEGEPAYDSLDALPLSVEAVIIEVPKADSEQWVRSAIELGIGHVWIHMGCETPAVLQLAQETPALTLRHGTCAVQYLDGAFPHSVHKLIRKVLKRY